MLNVVALADGATAVAESNEVPQRLLECLTHLQDHLRAPQTAPSPVDQASSTMKHSRYREQYREKRNRLQQLYDRAVRIFPCPAVLIREVATAMTRGAQLDTTQVPDMVMREYIDDVARLERQLDALEAVDTNEQQQTRCARLWADCAVGFDPKVLGDIDKPHSRDTAAPSAQRLKALMNRSTAVGSDWQCCADGVRRRIQDISFGERWWTLVSGALDKHSMEDHVFTECLSNVSSSIYLQYAEEDASSRDTAKSGILPQVITVFGKHRQSLVLSDSDALNNIESLQQHLVSVKKLTSSANPTLLCLWPVLRALEQRQTALRQVLRPWHDSDYTDTFTPQTLRLSDMVAVFDYEAHESVLKLELCQRAVEGGSFDLDAIERDVQRYRECRLAGPNVGAQAGDNASGNDLLLNRYFRKEQIEIIHSNSVCLGVRMAEMFVATCGINGDKRAFRVAPLYQIGMGEWIETITWLLLQQCVRSDEELGMHDKQTVFQEILNHGPEFMKSQQTLRQILDGEVERICCLLANDATMRQSTIEVPREALMPERAAGHLAMLLHTIQSSNARAQKNMTIVEAFEAPNSLTLLSSISNKIQNTAESLQQHVVVAGTIDTASVTSYVDDLQLLLTELASGDLRTFSHCTTSTTKEVLETLQNRTVLLICLCCRVVEVRHMGTVDLLRRSTRALRSPILSEPQRSELLQMDEASLHAAVLTTSGNVRCLARSLQSLQLHACFNYVPDSVSLMNDLDTNLDQVSDMVIQAGIRCYEIAGMAIALHQYVPQASAEGMQAWDDFARSLTEMFDIALDLSPEIIAQVLAMVVEAHVDRIVQAGRKLGDILCSLIPRLETVVKSFLLRMLEKLQSTLGSNAMVQEQRKLAAAMAQARSINPKAFSPIDGRLVLHCERLVNFQAVDLCAIQQAACAHAAAGGVDGLHEEDVLEALCVPHTVARILMEILNTDFEGLLTLATQAQVGRCPTGYSAYHTYKQAVGSVIEWLNDSVGDRVPGETTETLPSGVASVFGMLHAVHEEFKTSLRQQDRELQKAGDSEIVSLVPIADSATVHETNVLEEYGQLKAIRSALREKKLEAWVASFEHKRAQYLREEHRKAMDREQALEGLQITYSLFYEICDSTMTFAEVWQTHCSLENIKASHSLPPLLAAVHTCIPHDITITFWVDKDAGIGHIEQSFPGNPNVVYQRKRPTTNSSGTKFVFKVFLSKRQATSKLVNLSRLHFTMKENKNFVLPELCHVLTLEPQSKFWADGDMQKTPVPGVTFKVTVNKAITFPPLDYEIRFQFCFGTHKHNKNCPARGCTLLDPMCAKYVPRRHDNLYFCARHLNKNLTLIDALRSRVDTAGKQLQKTTPRPDENIDYPEARRRQCEAKKKEDKEDDKRVVQHGLHLQFRKLASEVNAFAAEHALNTRAAQHIAFDSLTTNGPLVSQLNACEALWKVIRNTVNNIRNAVQSARSLRSQGELEGHIETLLSSKCKEEISQAWTCEAAIQRLQGLLVRICDFAVSRLVLLLDQVQFNALSLEECEQIAKSVAAISTTIPSTTFSLVPDREKSAMMDGMERCQELLRQRIITLQKAHLRLQGLLGYPVQRGILAGACFAALFANALVSTVETIPFTAHDTQILPTSAHVTVQCGTHVVKSVTDINGHPMQRQLLFTNTTNQIIQLCIQDDSSITSKQSDLFGVDVEMDVALSVPPFGSMELSVYFRPHRVGHHTRVLQIEGLNGVGSCVLELTADVCECEVLLDRAELDFGSVHAGQQTVHVGNIALTNPTNAVIVVRCCIDTASSTVFSLSCDRILLKPRSTQKVAVRAEIDDNKMGSQVADATAVFYAASVSNPIHVPVRIHFEMPQIRVYHVRNNTEHMLESSQTRLFNNLGYIGHDSEIVVRSEAAIDTTWEFRQWLSDTRTQMKRSLARTLSLGPLGSKRIKCPTPQQNCGVNGEITIVDAGCTRNQTLYHLQGTQQQATVRFDEVKVHCDVSDLLDGNEFLGFTCSIKPTSLSPTAAIVDFTDNSRVAFPSKSQKKLELETQKKYSITATYFPDMLSSQIQSDTLRAVLHPQMEETHVDVKLNWKTPDVNVVPTGAHWCGMLMVGTKEVYPVEVTNVGTTLAKIDVTVVHDPSKTICEVIKYKKSKPVDGIVQNFGLKAGKDNPSMHFGIHVTGTREGPVRVRVNWSIINQVDVLPNQRRLATVVHSIVLHGYCSRTVRKPSPPSGMTSTTLQLDTFCSESLNFADRICGQQDEQWTAGRIFEVSGIDPGQISSDEFNPNDVLDLPIASLGADTLAHVRSAANSCDDGILGTQQCQMVFYAAVRDATYVTDYLHTVFQAGCDTSHRLRQVMHVLSSAHQNLLQASRQDASTDFNVVYHHVDTSLRAAKIACGNQVLQALKFVDICVGATETNIATRVLCELLSTSKLVARFFAYARASRIKESVLFLLPSPQRKLLKQFFQNKAESAIAMGDALMRETDENSDGDYSRFRDILRCKLKGVYDETTHCEAVLFGLGSVPHKSFRMFTDIVRAVINSGKHLDGMEVARMTTMLVSFAAGNVGDTETGWDEHHFDFLRVPPPDCPISQTPIRNLVISPCQHKFEHDELKHLFGKQQPEATGFTIAEDAPTAIPCPVCNVEFRWDEVVTRKLDVRSDVVKSVKKLLKAEQVHEITKAMEAIAHECPNFLQAPLQVLLEMIKLCAEIVVGCRPNSTQRVSSVSKGTSLLKNLLHVCFGTNAGSSSATQGYASVIGVVDAVEDMSPVSTGVDVLRVLYKYATSRNLRDVSDHVRTISNFASFLYADTTWSSATSTTFQTFMTEMITCLNWDKESPELVPVVPRCIDWLVNHFGAIKSAGGQSTMLSAAAVKQLSSCLQGHAWEPTMSSAARIISGITKLRKHECIAAELLPVIDSLASIPNSESCSQTKHLWNFVSASTVAVSSDVDDASRSINSVASLCALGSITLRQCTACCGNKASAKPLCTVVLQELLYHNPAAVPVSRSPGVITVQRRISGQQTGSSGTSGDTGPCQGQASAPVEDDGDYEDQIVSICNRSNRIETIVKEVQDRLRSTNKSILDPREYLECASRVKHVALLWRNTAAQVHAVVYLRDARLDDAGRVLVVCGVQLLLQLRFLNIQRIKELKFFQEEIDGLKRWLAGVNVDVLDNDTRLYFEELHVADDQSIEMYDFDLPVTSATVQRRRKIVQVQHNPKQYAESDGVETSDSPQPNTNVSTAHTPGMAESDTTSSHAMANVGGVFDFSLLDAQMSRKSIIPSAADAMPGTNADADASRIKNKIRSHMRNRPVVPPAASDTAALDTATPSMSNNLTQVEISHDFSNAAESASVALSHMTFAPHHSANDIAGIDFDELYGARAVGVRRGGQMPDYQRAEVVRSSKPEKWTYAMLQQSSALMAMCDRVWGDVIKVINRYKRSASDDQVFEWLFLVDNSGSMCASEQQLTESLVLIMEILRKLECRFSIARFGNRNGQRILKDFETPMSSEIGQSVLESFSFDEGTYPATAIQAVAKKVWPAAEPVPLSNTVGTPHRIMILITDGMTQETKADDYTRVIRERHLSMGILRMQDPKIRNATSAGAHKLIAELRNLQRYVDIEEVTNPDGLPAKVARLMVTKFQKAFSQVDTAPRAPSAPTVAHVDVQQPALDPAQALPTMPLCKTVRELQSLVQDAGTDALYSSGTSAVPVVEAKDPSASRVDDADVLAAVETLTQLHRRIGTPRAPPHADKFLMSEEQWQRVETTCVAQIDALGSALEDTLMPFNKFTRRRADVRGSTLHLQGLIKAIVSGWNYKKFLSTKTAGPRRSYAAVFAVDLSPSMEGSLLASAFEALVTFINSLERCSIDNFAIIAFASEVIVLKSFDMPWDSATKYMVLSNLFCRNSITTRDSDAVEVALSLFRQLQPPGEHKLFVFTDGYGSATPTLHASLCAAEQQSVDVIAVGVGCEQTALQNGYGRWIKAAVPAVLPEALRELLGDAENRRDKNALDTRLMDINRQFRDDRPVEDIVKDSEKAFQGLAHKLSEDRQARLCAGSVGKVKVDIAFCIDCTGSMAPWFKIAQGQAAAIVKGIAPKIKEQFPSVELELRFGILGYRDFADGDKMFEDCPFTTDTDTIISFLQSMQASGGGDNAENVLGALDRLRNDATWQWSGQAKFIVLLADAPGHGLCDASSGLVDDNPSGDPNGLTVDSVVKSLFKYDEEQNLESHWDLFFCRIRKSDTQKMEDDLRATYNQYGGEHSIEMTTTDLVDGDRSAHLVQHIVLCLDESGSMAGSKWQSLQQAVAGFRQQKMHAQGGEHFVSVIQFASNARVTYEHGQINYMKSLKMQSGGTEFGAPLRKAMQLFQQYPSQEPVLVFMSDGNGSNGRAEMCSLKQHFPLVAVHTIAFGSDADHKKLREMGVEDGKGKFHSSSTGLELFNVFQSIAEDCTSLNGLVSNIGEVISRMASTKIMLEYL
eukprot:m.1625156 g.1625156  ORF g.1625156 m.1625156 type:complete len:4446 (-) comp25391_c0_seq1:138-13475(-)